MENEEEHIVVDKMQMPKGCNLLDWGLSYKAYTYLVAIANYSSNDHCSGRARFYLSKDYGFKEKSSTKRGEGSFMSAILEGDFVLAHKRGDLYNRRALATALLNEEIEL